MFRKISLVLAFVFAALSLVASPAMAAVTFDPATGTGFVGKGDVQLLFGWNNKQLQDNLSGVGFVYTSTETADVTCEWETVTGKGKVILHDVTQQRETSVNSVVSYETRNNKQGSVTGINLVGFGATTVVGDAIPNIGDSCKQADDAAIVTDVVVTSSIGGGLSLVYGGQYYALPNTPVV